MNFNEYQGFARQTAAYHGKMPLGVYPALEVCDEAGEVAGKIKKLYRDANGEVTPELKEAIKLEMGDVLWPLANLAWDLGIMFDDVATANIEKLRSRQKRGVIQGSGDNR